MTHGVEYGAFTGLAEIDIDCQACGETYEVELRWNGESWEPTHGFFFGGQFHKRDKAEWRNCPHCGHTNQVEASSNTDEPLILPAETVSGAAKLPAARSLSQLPVCTACKGDGLARFGEAVVDDDCPVCRGEGFALPRRSPFELHLLRVTETYGDLYRKGVL